MSLIVGAVVGERVILIGETAETKHKWHQQPRGERTPPWTRGVLKVYHLNDTVAFGFADNIVDFSESFELLISSRSAEELVSRTQTLQHSGRKFDLIIGEVGYPFLRIVRSGAVIEATEGFVGDAEAYTRFRAHCKAWNPPFASDDSDRTSDGLSEGGMAYSRMFSAFEKTLDEHPDTSVAGIITPMATCNGGFSYMIYTKTFLPTQTIPSNQWTPLKLLGSAEEGCYTGELCCARGNRQFLGFYPLQGGFGIVFPPERDRVRRARLLPATDPAEWMFVTMKLLGEPLLTCWLQDHHCMRAGERALKEERWCDAVYLYEIRNWKSVFVDRPDGRERFLSGYATALYNSGNPLQSLSLLNDFTGSNVAPRAVEILMRVHEAIPRRWN